MADIQPGGGHLGAAPARLAHFGDRPLQLSLPVLHARGCLRGGLRVSLPPSLVDPRRDQAGCRAVHATRRHETADHRRGAAPAPGCDRHCQRSERPARPAGPGADDQRLATGGACRRPAQSRPQAHYREPRQPGRRSLPDHERRQGRCRSGARGNRRGKAGGTQSHQAQRGDPEGPQRTHRPRPAGTLSRHRDHRAVHRVHGCGHAERLASG